MQTRSEGQGGNAPNQKTNWVRGAGEERIKARSPSFDHTFFSDRGHYMRMEIIAGETDGTIGKFKDTKVLNYMI